MIWWARVLALGVPLAAATYLVGSAVLHVGRAYRDSRRGWTCACGERFASRMSGPAPFHRLDH